MRWLNYQHLFYFWNIARFGSVTVASQRLRLAQPTISAQIKAFEEILGEKLFSKEGRNLKLTDAGRMAFRYADQIFSLGQEFLEVLDGKSEGQNREIKIGIADVVPKSLAYRLIAPALGLESGFIVTCLEDKTERLLADLSIGEIDLVIADRPIPPNVKVKAFNHFIGECGVSFLATPYLAKQYRKGFPKSLDRAPLFMPTQESAVSRELEQWFSKVEVTPTVIATFQDRALMKIAAREGKGIIPVPSVVSDEVAKEFHLAYVGKSDEVKEHIYLISLEKRLKNPIIVKMCSDGQKKLFP